MNKTSAEFVKAIDVAVGDAIEAWEQVRPVQPTMIDQKTGERVQLLFAYRTTKIGQLYLNDSVIPMLCRKAGVPTREARGNITSHRARSTIASQLASAREPLSLFELMEWLGHRHPASTLHYVKTSPIKQVKALKKAGYFERDVRTIDVWSIAKSFGARLAPRRTGSTTTSSTGGAQTSFSLNALIVSRVRAVRFTCQRIPRKCTCLHPRKPHSSASGASSHR